MKIVCIKPDNKMYELNINKNVTKDLNNLDNAKGDGDIECVFNWIHDNNKIDIYGWLSGEKNLKNDHTLPPSGLSHIIDENSEDTVFYGNIYVVCSKKEKYIDYHIHDYGNFYYIMNEINNDGDYLEDYIDSEKDECEIDEEIDEYEIDECEKNVNIINIEKHYDTDLFKVNKNIDYENILDYDMNNYLKI